ncbi:putative recombination initiation defects 3 isoform X2 [Rutidosis leptorrhynchoides]|uniref:putative recombination initiation defects 3 isoform X2 n=1 Tax=Rutidosis leptorrhynchoides TaxID=125765 RepID=UPI003A997664
MMKINKACDLSSISVLPPQSRRRGVSCSLRDMSSTLRNSQPPSQPQRSQQSFSQGISSQHNAIISQFSQNSQDETLTNDQLVISQDRENSVKRFSSLPLVNQTREENQMQMSRSSKGLMRKWGSGISEQKSQMSEELEHRIGTMEGSLSKFGMMLESLQTDILQVNKGTKELAIDMESIRQKLIAQDNSLQTINKGQEDVKSSLHGELKSISDQLKQDIRHQNSQEISNMLSGLQEKIGVFILNLRNDLSKSFTNEIRALGCKLKALDHTNPPPTFLPPRAVSNCVNPQGMFPQKNPAVPPKVQLGTQIKVEMGSWNSVKREHANLKSRVYNEEHKCNPVSQTELERELRVDIESDEDINGGFTFFSDENETGKFLIDKAKEETERMLRKARRRKRKHCNTIIIN